MTEQTTALLRRAGKSLLHRKAFDSMEPDVSLDGDEEQLLQEIVEFFKGDSEFNEIIQEVYQQHGVATAIRDGIFQGMQAAARDLSFNS